MMTEMYVGDKDGLTNKAVKYLGIRLDSMLKYCK